METKPLTNYIFELPYENQLFSVDLGQPLTIFTGVNSLERNRFFYDLYEKYKSKQISNTFFLPIERINIDSLHILEYNGYPHLSNYAFTISKLMNQILKDDINFIRFDPFGKFRLDYYLGDVCIYYYFNDDKIVFNEFSNELKSLASLFIFLNYSKNLEGTYIFIDEPELCLHPATQIRFARFLVELFWFNIKIVLNTNSDYIIRQINNMIILGSNCDPISKLKIRDELAERFNFKPCHFINANMVSSYEFTEKIIKHEITRNDGIESNSIDEVINDNELETLTLVANLTEH